MPDDIVVGEPSKDFFISMITRDLGLTDCILDLIDNSVDQAVSDSGADVVTVLLSGKRGPSLKSLVHLTLSPKSFVIRDDCAGISITEAKERVFKFGDPQERGADGGLSVYGIGMKRAFFKLGRRIEVLSQTSRERFRVVIDVPKWRVAKKWDFHFADQERGLRNAETGTTITITDLTEETSSRFERKSFREELRRRVSSTYALFLSRGLTVALGDENVTADLPSIGVGGKLRPARKRFRKGPVEILIIAGVTPRDDHTPRGWYVFCNGRMVLEADKSRATGWGGGSLPQWHTKYGHFVGYVHFHSRDVRELPWTTTKQGVVAESEVYQAALSEMALQGRPVLDFLTEMYPSDLEAEAVAARDLLDAAANVPITKVPRKDAKFRWTPRKRGDSSLVTIAYKRPRGAVKRAKALVDEDISNRKLGEHTFDYFIEHEGS